MTKHRNLDTGIEDIKLLPGLFVGKLLKSIEFTDDRNTPSGTSIVFIFHDDTFVMIGAENVMHSTLMGKCPECMGRQYIDELDMIKCYNCGLTVTKLNIEIDIQKDNKLAGWKMSDPVNPHRPFGEDDIDIIHKMIGERHQLTEDPYGDGIGWKCPNPKCTYGVHDMVSPPNFCPECGTMLSGVWRLTLRGIPQEDVPGIHELLLREIYKKPVPVSTGKLIAMFDESPAGLVADAVIDEVFAMFRNPPTEESDHFSNCCCPECAKRKQTPAPEPDIEWLAEVAYNAQLPHLKKHWIHATERDKENIRISIRAILAAVGDGAALAGARPSSGGEERPAEEVPKT